MNLREKLPAPFFILAPMDDVTDTVFRQVIASCAPPDLYFTEFVNVDGLQSPGRANLLKKLQFSANERPIIAQLWGKNPENYYKTARQIADGTLIDEANWNARRSGLDKMQGSKEQGASSTKSTASEARTQVTQQFAKSNGRVSGLARNQADAARVSGGYAGVDINMGCPDKTIIKNGCCAALIDNRELAAEIIQATKQGVLDASASAMYEDAALGNSEDRSEVYKEVQREGTSLPISVKTRVGLKVVDLSWHEFLLKQKLNMLTIHGRTAKEMSKVPANWDLIGQIREMRDHLSPTTLIVGNGDVLSRQQGEELAKKHKLDGIMIGRGVFHDPFVFSKKSPWASFSREQRLQLYKSHVDLFINTWKNNERKVHTLNKFCKIYIQEFSGAKELRENLMSATTPEALVTILTDTKLIA